VLRLEELYETILSGSPRRPCLRPSGAKVEALVRGEHDNRHRAYSWRAVEQIEAALVIRRFQIVRFDQFLRGFDIARPLLRRERALQKLRGGIDKYQTGHLIGIRAREEPRNQATPRMSDKNVWPRFLGCHQ
jgi:hypothetical protein